MSTTWMLKVMLFLACINIFYIDSYALLKPDVSLPAGGKTIRHETAGTEITAGRQSSLQIYSSHRYISPEQNRDSIQWNGMENTAEYADEYQGNEQGRPVISGRRSSRRRNHTSSTVRTSHENISRRNSGYKHYRVKRGDTLFRISRKFHVSVNTIRRINNIEQRNTLFTGQRLRIPTRERLQNGRSSGSSSTRRGPRFSWPLTSVLTIRRDSLDGVRPIGIIITGRPGADVQCSAQGTVKKIGSMRGYGRYIIVKHGTSYLTVYANLAHIFVQEGQRVPRGRTIGKINHSDHSLHFQINKGGKAKNPLTLLPERS